MQYKNGKLSIVAKIDLNLKNMIIWQVVCIHKVSKMGYLPPIIKPVIFNNMACPIRWFYGPCSIFFGINSCILSVMFSLIFSLFGDTNNVRSIGCRFGLLLNLNRFIIIEKLLIFDWSDL